MINKYKRIKNPKKQIISLSFCFFILLVFCYFADFSFSEDAQENINLSEVSKGVDEAKENNASKRDTENLESISLDLKNIDITELFKVLSLKTGLTIVPSKQVTGRVNLFLNNIKFEDVLDIILVTQELACERKGDIYMIVTSAEYKTRYGKDYDEKRKFASYKLKYAEPASVFKALGEMKSDIGKIIVDESSGTVILLDIPEKLKIMEAVILDLDQPLETEIFDIKHADAEQMKTHIESVLTAGSGQALIDEQSSRMIVTELPEKMKRLKRIVKAFDKEPPEVFIEAEIWQISLKNEYQRGIDWEKVTSADLDYPEIDFVGTFPVSASFTPSPDIDTSSMSASIGTLAIDDYIAAFNLLETYGDVKIISRPKIAVVDKQEAKIMIGSKEAYITQTLSQGETTTVTSESVEFIDVGVKLNVVPNINADGMITMSIKPEVSSVRETITTAAGSSIPIVETSEAETVVKVEDGKMIIIGGLLKEEEREDVSGIPILSKIPFIGAFFGSRAELTRNTELVIFLTPHIISGKDSMVKEEVMPSMPDVSEPGLFKGIKSLKKKAKDVVTKREARKKEKEILPPDWDDRSETSVPAIDLKNKFKGIKKYD